MLGREAVLFHLVIERSLANSELSGRYRDVTAVLFQGAVKNGCLELGHNRFQRQHTQFLVNVATVILLLLFSWGWIKQQVIFGNCLALGQTNRPLDKILQFADIAGPVMSQQPVED